MIDKLFVALVTLAFALPVEAGTAHDFAPGRDYGTPATASANRGRSLDGQCYHTKGSDRVCFRVSTFAASGGSKSSKTQSLGLFKPLWRTVIASSGSKP